LVVSWNTNVHDEAARTFVESFYHYISSSKEDCLCFKDAYECVLIELKLRGWLILNPEEHDSVLSEQKKQNRIKLEAAGVPKLFEA